ncbi:MAG: hypothetical protein ACXVCV_07950, partial [Polyangia bacterium]
MAIIVLLASGPAAAQTRSWTKLTTGNGFGFQVFDAQTNKIIRFLEHPYRYLHPSASPMSYGQERRSLVYDFYFGV